MQTSPMVNIWQGNVLPVVTRRSFNPFTSDLDDLILWSIKFKRNVIGKKTCATDLESPSC